MVGVAGPRRRYGRGGCEWGWCEGGGCEWGGCGQGCEWWCELGLGVLGRDDLLWGHQGPRHARRRQGVGLTLGLWPRLGLRFQGVGLGLSVWLGPTRNCQRVWLGLRL